MASLVEQREAYAATAAEYKELMDTLRGEPTEEGLARADELGARLAELEPAVQQLASVEQHDRKAHAAYDWAHSPVGALPFPHSAGRDRAGVPDAFRNAFAEAPRSLGQRFVEDAAYAEWFKNIAPSGHIAEKRQVQSPAVSLPGGFRLGASVVTGVSQTSGGALVFPDIQPGLVQLPFRPLTLRDIVTNLTTTSDSVEYVRVTGYTNNAAMVAEATATSGGSGSKPESALALLKVLETVKTVAHWIPATTRALADASQLRGLIDAFLLDGLAQEIEDQMVTGDGTGENFTGIAHVSGVQAQAWSSDLLETTRKARTLVRLVGRARPTAYVFHPNDWEEIDLLQDNEARYFMGGPREIMTPRLWGLPVVESEAVTEGTGYIADWRTVVLWDREQANIQVSNSHADFFTRNLIAILAESRHAMGVLRPEAIVSIDLTA